MAKHRRSRALRVLSMPGGQVTVLRGGVLAVIVVACAIAGMLAYAASANSGARADILAGAAGHGAAAPAVGGPPPGKVTAAARARAARARAARPRPAATPSVGWRRVAGSSVTAVGDSVMLASAPALEQALPGIYVDAQVGRQFYTGLGVIAALRASGRLRRIVVVGLGTNGTVTPAEISQLLAEIGRHRRLVLVNTYEARSWEYEVNSALAAAARHYPNVVLANWFATIFHRTYLLWSDGIHPQPAGALAYARMLRAAVDRAGNLPQRLPGAARVR